MRDQSPKPAEIARAKQARLVAIVLVATMGLWLLGQALGGHFGWEARYAFLFDLAALAGFGFALIVTIQIWRARQR